MTADHATVIGASGYIGSHLVTRLRSRGLRLCCPTKGEEGRLAGVDLGDVYYCAGLTVDYAQDPVATAEAHLGLISRLLQPGRFKRVVYLSSTRLYDSLAGQRVEETTALRLEPLQPRHLYDLTKAAGESLCLALAGERTRILRLPCIWSQGAGAPGFLPDLLRRIAGGPTQANDPPIVTKAKPNQARHYLHLEDLLDAMEASVGKGIEPIVHLASDEKATSNAELFTFLKQRFGVNVTFGKEDETQPVLLPPLLDLGRYRELLGQQPRPFLTRLDSLLTTLPPTLGR